ncbi:MAG: lytic transglycosylase domain-containing protein [Cocleimonas sp.]|nr:lytic transglycosylase domain-containing protein [Cocleimonas sp.]
MLNKPLTKLLILFFLIPMQFALAAPKKSVISDNELQLAMLDLNRQKLVQPKIVKRQKRSVRIQSKISKRRGASKLPSNCLKWNAHQINRKAKKFDKAITEYSRKYRVDKNLVKAVITVESCFRVKAKSHANAHGLMQLIPATAKRFGVSDSYNAKQNIRGGVKYLKFLKARYKGNLKKTIAAYNAGEGAVDKYKGIPPYKETRNYVKNVLKTYAKLNPKASRVSAVYQPPKMGNKAGRHGWQYNRRLAPHLYKQ